MTDTKGLKLPLKITEKYGDSNAFYVDVEDASGDCFLSGNEISEIEELQLLVTACNSHHALKEENERLREALGSIEVGTEDSSDAALISINSIARYALKYATPPDSAERSCPASKKGADDGRID